MKTREEKIKTLKGLLGGKSKDDVLMSEMISLPSWVVHTHGGDINKLRAEYPGIIQRDGKFYRPANSKKGEQPTWFK